MTDFKARLKSLRGDSSIADFENAQVLFHGTCEPIDGKLDTGAFDDVFWTGETPSIAQAYIPLAGLSQIIAMPYEHRLSERITPSQDGAFSNLMRQMGHWPREVAYTDRGELRSWTVDPGHPTYAEGLAYLESLGYRFERQTVTVSIKLDGRATTILPADWKMPGLVYVSDGRGLKIKDLRPELRSDLMDPGHLRLDAFARARDQGFDGIMIDDFAQCGRAHTNFGHRSIGLFGRALEARSLLKFEATHCDLTDDPAPATPQFTAFLASL